MIIEIKGKAYNVSFGVRFVREVDAKDKRNELFGAGVQFLASRLMVGDVLALEDLIFCGIEGTKPKMADLDEYIDLCEDIEALTDKVIEELKKSNASRRQITLAEKVVKANIPNG